ncbi:MAG: hypothetical protein QXU98_06990 [Candidatus Parvarchaeota archaeon]
MTFSPKYKMFNDWQTSFKGSDSYRNRIVREHSKYPNASLSQLRGHASKGKKPVSELKPEPVYKKSWNSITKKELKLREKCLDVLRRVKNGQSMSKASRELHTKPGTVIMNTNDSKRLMASGLQRNTIKSQGS